MGGMVFPTIPEYIIVHLGAPDAPARNIRVPFAEYIKNVASSEIYPTWPESAIRANILAQISFALNRVYTEFYRSRGYDFDITNDTRYDQAFVEGRDIFQNISAIVDDIFNNYVRRQGNIEPYFTQYCSGTTVQCDGLSQWGTVPLAEQGLVPYQILQRFYGSDIEIVRNAPLSTGEPSYPGVPLRLGSASEEVRTVQRQLNRIGRNYPSIPNISETDGIFDPQTEDAVKAFQRIFNLDPDGIVGKATWYKIKSVYAGVKGLSELYSEGLTLAEEARVFPTRLSEGDTGIGVATIQYYLSVLGFFYDDLPLLAVDGVFGPATRDAVIAFQRKYSLTPDGTVGRQTWNQIAQAYDNIRNSLPEPYSQYRKDIYPGRFLFEGDTGPEVLLMQRYLNAISRIDPSIPPVQEDGEFGPQTAAAVRAIQQQFGYTVNGDIGPLTWAAIVSRYYDTLEY
ncbi:MAG: spore cortex-lytic protein [Clostridiales bacterium]|nr:spore cortex-lytic protein [Clostridiales bacterium]